MIELNGKKGLIVGVANEHSIAWGCAKIFHACGAELAITYLNDKALPHVEPLAGSIEAALLLPLNVEDDAQMAAVFANIAQKWGKLDFVIHSIAFADKNDLHGRVTDCSRDGFLRAMDISCHSFIRLARLAEPLMSEGGCLQTMTYLGADEVVPNYGVMGPVKAALQSATRYLASELGPKGIRVHALSPGTLLTRAASGIRDFDKLMEDSVTRAPLHKLVSIDDIGTLSAFLASDLSKTITGSTMYIDSGYHILA